MHVEPFVGGLNPPKWQKKAQFCIYMLMKTINLISEYWLYKILFDDNTVISDYNMFNFKIYLILKLWYIFNILIILKTLWIKLWYIFTNQLNENFSFNYKIVIINFLFKVFF